MFIGRAKIIMGVDKNWVYNGREIVVSSIDIHNGRAKIITGVVTVHGSRKVVMGCADIRNGCSVGHCGLIT